MAVCVLSGVGYLIYLNVDTGKVQAVDEKDNITSSKNSNQVPNDISGTQSSIQMIYDGNKEWIDKLQEGADKCLEDYELVERVALLHQDDLDLLLDEVRVKNPNSAIRDEVIKFVQNCRIKYIKSELAELGEQNKNGKLDRARLASVGQLMKIQSVSSRLETTEIDLFKYLTLDKDEASKPFIDLKSMLALSSLSYDLIIREEKPKAQYEKLKEAFLKDGDKAISFLDAPMKEAFKKVMEQEKLYVVAQKIIDGDETDAATIRNLLKKKKEIGLNRKMVNALKRKYHTLITELPSTDAPKNEIGKDSKSKKTSQNSDKETKPEKSEDKTVDDKKSINDISAEIDSILSASPEVNNEVLTKVIEKAKELGIDTVKLLSSMLDKYYEELNNAITEIKKKPDGKREEAINEAQKFLKQFEFLSKHGGLCTGGTSFTLNSILDKHYESNKKMLQDYIIGLDASKEGEPLYTSAVEVVKTHFSDQVVKEVSIYLKSIIEQKEEPENSNLLSEAKNTFNIIYFYINYRTKLANVLNPKVEAEMQFLIHPTVKSWLAMNNPNPIDQAKALIILTASLQYLASPFIPAPTLVEFFGLYHLLIRILLYSSLAKAIPGIRTIGDCEILDSANTLWSKGFGIAACYSNPKDSTKFNPIASPVIIIGIVYAYMEIVRFLPVEKQIQLMNSCIQSQTHKRPLDLKVFLEDKKFQNIFFYFFSIMEKGPSAPNITKFPTRFHKSVRGKALIEQILPTLESLAGATYENKLATLANQYANDPVFLESFGILFRINIGIN